MDEEGSQPPATRTVSRRIPREKPKDDAILAELPPPRDTGRKRDWAGIAQEFIEGIPVKEGSEERTFLNMRQLSERHGVAHQTMRTRAGKERWNERKEAFALQVIRERQRKRTKKLAEASLTFDESNFKTAELGVNLITQRLAEVAQEISRRRAIRERAMQKIDQGLPIEKEELYSAINYREMEGLANAARTFQDIGMKALGTDVRKFEVSGPDGGALEVSQSINVTHEIARDDPERVTALLAAMQDAGVLPKGVIDNIIDAEVVDDEGEEGAVA